MVTVGNRTIWQSLWVNVVCAVLAGTSDNYFTMEGVGNPVSASDQGEKACPQEHILLIFFWVSLFIVL